MNKKFFLGVLITSSLIGEITTNKAQGTPPEQIIKHGKMGTIVYDSVEEIHSNGDAFWTAFGTLFSERKHLHSQRLITRIRQRREVFFYPDRSLYLISETVCKDPGHAQTPWDCDSNTRLWKNDPVEGFVDFAAVPGTYDKIEVHSTIPIFVTETLGSGDSGDSYAVYNLKGKLLCKKELVYPSIDVNNLSAKKGKLKCPGEKGKTVSIGM